MPVFKALGREWKLTIDAPKIKEVRHELKIDLAALDGSAFDKLNADTILLIDTLWVLCRSQAGSVTDVQFGEGLIGDAIADATKALTDAWLDFFPPEKRSLLASLVQKQAAVTTKGIALAMAKINDPNLEEKLLAAMEEKMVREMTSLLTSPSGATNSPA
jgi:hypothetical protein